MQSPIPPDTKSWTWVLERRCPDCGFEAGAGARSELAGLVRSVGPEWADLRARGGVQAGRTRPGVWSSLEYACHVRDVLARYRERVTLMCSEDDPLFANWDQDATAVEDRYDDQDPAEVVAALEECADALADLLAGLDAAQWERPGRRSDGESFTVESLCRYMVHDPIHHYWDVTGIIR